MRADRGFTLVEILVSLAIMGLVLPVVLTAFTNGARSRSVATGRTTAAYLLRDRLTEMEASGVPQVGEASGEFEAGAAYAWTSSVSTTEVEGLYDVVVTIHWQERGETRSFSVRTYLADPTLPSGGGAVAASPGG